MMLASILTIIGAVALGAFLGVAGMHAWEFWVAAICCNVETDPDDELDRLRDEDAIPR